MIEQAADMTLLTKFKDAIYSFALFGMTTHQVIETKVVITAIIIGVGSSFAASYVNAERNAVKLEATIQRLDQSNKEQSDFRTEMRAIVANRSAFEQLMTERVAILEATMRATHPQNGMNGNGSRK